MRIAIDATGGDHGESVMVPGAIEGARTLGVALALVGPTAVIQKELHHHDTAGIDLIVVEAPDQIGMDEYPGQAVRRKRNSSIVVGVKEVRAGRAAAFVSAGNSGAVLAAALFELGMIKGIERPAIASYFPTVHGHCLFLDLGAVTDPKPQHLVDWALMGQVYAERILDVRNPTIGLLSNGEEPGKGNRFVQETFPLLAATPGLNFVGNVEGKDLPGGTVDVVVTDGFTGNVALKTAEGAATFLVESLRQELTATLPRRIAAAFLRPAFRKIRDRMDYSAIGGAPLLGINGTVIIAHGRSNQRAIVNAIRAAKTSVEVDLPGGIMASVASAHAAATRQDLISSSSEPAP